MITTTNKQFIMNGKVLKTPQEFGEEIIFLFENTWAEHSDLIKDVGDYIGSLSDKEEVIKTLCDTTAQSMKFLFGTDDGERVFQHWCIERAADAYEEVCDDGEGFVLDREWNLVNLATAGLLEAQDITIIIEQ